MAKTMVIKPVAGKSSKYGGPAYPSGSELRKIADQHPDVTEFVFDGTTERCSAQQAEATLGTHTTAANKLAAGVDRNVRQPNGGSGGGGSHYQVSLAGEALVVSNGEAQVVISKVNKGWFASQNVHVGKAMSALATQLLRERAEGKIDTLRQYVKASYVATLGDVSVPVESDDPSKAVGAVSQALFNAKRFELFAELQGPDSITISTTGLEDFEAWAKL